MLLTQQDQIVELIIGRYFRALGIGEYNWGRLIGTKNTPGERYEAISTIVQTLMGCDPEEAERAIFVAMSRINHDMLMTSVYD